MIDYGMDPQTAVHEPRWVWGRTWGERVEGVRMESRVAPEVIEKLRKHGHHITIVGDFDGVMGHAGIIEIDDRGFLRGEAIREAMGRQSAVNSVFKTRKRQYEKKTP